MASGASTAGPLPARRLSEVYTLVTLLHRSRHGLDREPPVRTIGRVPVKFVDGSGVTIVEQPSVRYRVTPPC